ncbi:hypothetical protein ACJZ2D_012567 [Fusarium nematophilum]
MEMGLLPQSCRLYCHFPNLPLCSAASPPTTRHSLPRQAKELDWLGILLNTGIYACFVLAFTFGDPEWAWDGARFITCVVLFAIFLAVFALTQRYAVLTTKIDRLFPCEFLSDFQMVLLYVAIACGGAGLFVAVYYIPLYFLRPRRHGHRGRRPAAPLHLLLRRRHPRVRLLHAPYAMYTITADSPASYTYGFSALLGFSLTVSQASYAVAARIVRPDRLAESIQFLNISQGGSQMLGLAIASAIFQSRAFDGMSKVLEDKGFTTEEIWAAIKRG